jgi:type VI protein secretion system component Hcp
VLFLKIDGIAGSSHITGYVGEIELDTYRWAVERHGATTASAFHWLVAHKSAGVSGPQLWLHAANQSRIRSMVLSGVHTGGEKLLRYLTIEFTGVRVRNFEEVADGEERPRQTIAFDYETIVTTFTTYHEDGRVSAVHKTGWNVVKNVPI